MVIASITVTDEDGKALVMSRQERSLSFRGITEEEVRESQVRETARAEVERLSLLIGQMLASAANKDL
jgi:hypothetical protein